MKPGSRGRRLPGLGLRVEREQKSRRFQAIPGQCRSREHGRRCSGPRPPAWPGQSPEGLEAGAEGWHFTLQTESDRRLSLRGGLDGSGLHGVTRPLCGNGPGRARPAGRTLPFSRNTFFPSVPFKTATRTPGLMSSVTRPTTSRSILTTDFTRFFMELDSLRLNVLFFRG